MVSGKREWAIYFSVIASTFVPLLVNVAIKQMLRVFPSRVLGEKNYSMPNLFCRWVLEMFHLLKCSDVDLRIQAGEAVALLYEAARAHQERYSWKREKELCSVLNG